MSSTRPIRPHGFQSPSKNIACQYFDYDKQNILRCDISAMETKPRRPADCDLDYGGAFEMNAKGPAARICHGDTAMDKSLPVLAYGEAAVPETMHSVVRIVLAIDAAFCSAERVTMAGSITPAANRSP